MTIGIVGLTIAYFSNATNVENIFNTNPYGTTFIEQFVSPDNWLPGDITPKTLIVTNSGSVDEAVRISFSEEWKPYNSSSSLNGWIHRDGTKSVHQTNEELNTDERVAIVNFDNYGDWTYSNGYYYYKYKLEPNDETSSLIKSVTFNSKTKLDDTCETTINGGVRTITCNSSGVDYDNATYKLTFNIETIQYDKYASAWGFEISLLDEKPQPSTIQDFIEKNTNPTTIEHVTDGDIHQMYVFEHEATEQTSALTDYRYIGDDPYNYVYFNCSDDSVIGTCEVWRIIGIFTVERTDPEDESKRITEQRMKIVRGTSLPENMKWDDRVSEYYPYENNGKNDWPESLMEEFLNGNYYNRLGAAATYGLKESARNKIDNAIYYLGQGSSYNYYGSAENKYIFERSNSAYNSERARNWEGKVALLYPSDAYLIYKDINDSYCYSTTTECSGDYATDGWIYNSNVLQGSNTISHTWFLNSYNGNSFITFFMRDNGNLDYGDAAYEMGIRSVVYLKSSIKFVSGTGEISSPYILSS